MRNIVKLVVFASSLICLQLQAFDFEKVQGGDLSPYESVYRAFQDQQGYLWIGTGAKGFIRYSGEDFEIHDPEYKLGKFSHVRPMDHLIDGNDLWIATRNGVNKVNIETLENTLYEANLDDWENPENLRQGYVNILLKVKSEPNRIYFIGTRYIFYLDKAKNTFIKIVDYRTLKKPHFWKADTIGDQLWVGMVGRKEKKDDAGKVTREAVIGGVHIFDTEGELIKILHNSVDPNIPEDFEVITELKAIGNTMYIGTNKGLYSYDVDSDKLSKISPDVIGEHPIYRLSEGFDAKLWAAGTNIYEIDMVDGKVNQHSAGNPKTPYHTLYVDKEGTVWASYSGGGLYKKTRTPPSFKSIDPFLKIGLSFFDHEIKDWAIKDNYAWLGTSSGLILYNLESQEALEIEGLEKEHFVSLSIGSQYLWAATREKIYKVNLQTKSFQNTEIKKNKNEIYPFSSMGQVLLVKDRYLWISFQPDIGIYDTNTGEFTLNPDWIPSRIFNAGSAALGYNEKHNKMLFSAFGTGFYEVDLETKEVVEYLRGTNHIPPSDQGNIEVFDDYPLIYFWENLVAEYNFATKKMTPKTFPVKNIDCLVPHSDGARTWLFQGGGKAYLYDNNTKNAVPVSDIQDPQKQTLLSGFCKRIDGNTILAGTYGGLAIFNEISEANKFSSSPPPVVNGEIAIGNKNFKPLEDVVVESDENVVHLKIDMISLMNPKNNKILVKLEGIHDWVEYQGSSMETDYYKLPAGDSTLSIKGVNSQGVESKVKTYNISVQEIWYQTLLFYVALALGLMILIGAYTVSRFKIQKRELEKSKVKLGTIEEGQDKEISSMNKLLESSAKIAALNNSSLGLVRSLVKELQIPQETLETMLSMLKRTDLTNTQARYIDTIEDCSKQLHGHIESLNGLSQYKEAGLDSAYESLELVDLASSSISATKDFALKKGVSLDLEVLRHDVDEGVCVKVDSSRTSNVIVNASYSAIRRANPGDAVKIIARIGKADDKKIELKVFIEDESKAFNQEDLDRIFLGKDGASSRRGLKAAYDVAKSLGGSLEIEPGIMKGNRIVITLQFDQSIAVENKKQVANRKIESCIVALPSQFNKDGLNELVLDTGVSIKEYSSVDELSELGSVDLIAIKATPGLIGVISKIKANKNLSSSFIVGLTPDISEANKLKMLNEGCDAILSDSCSPLEMTRIINKLLNSKNYIQGSH